MKKSDLRVGNLIHSKDYYYNIEVETISDEGINHGWQPDGECVDKRDKYENLIGIDLTKDWLIYFGFKYLESGWFVKEILNSAVVELSFNLYEFKIAIDTKHHQSIFETHIRYVNELQNLFYSLIGDELNYVFSKTPTR